MKLDGFVCEKKTRAVSNVEFLRTLEKLRHAACAVSKCVNKHSNAIY